MEVTVIEHTPDYHEKAHMLQVLRKEIGEEAFRVAMAKLSSNHLIELIHHKGKKISRKDLVFRVNLTLIGYDCEPLSYGFFRSFY